MPASASVGGDNAGGCFPRVVPGSRAPFALPTALTGAFIRTSSLRSARVKHWPG